MIGKACGSLNAVKLALFLFRLDSSYQASGSQDFLKTHCEALMVLKISKCIGF